MNVEKREHIIDEMTGTKIKELLVYFFENHILKKVEDIERPLQQKYRNFLERSLGRFECYFNEQLEKEIWHLLLSNDLFTKINSIIKNEILKLGEGCIEDLCFIPVEGGTPIGNWHRDTIIEFDTDFIRDPYYISQIIYFDDLANTEFCLESNNNAESEPSIYPKQTIVSSKNSCVIFDGRMLHRGLENNTKNTRYALYIGYYVESYTVKETDNIHL